jgi:hypothetical protein
VPPLYRVDQTGEVYPRFLRRIRAALSRALRKTAYEFVRVQTTAEFSTHLALGTRSLPDTVWEIGRALVELERTFDRLIEINAMSAGGLNAAGHLEGVDFGAEVVRLI